MGDVLTSFVQDFQGERPRTNYSGDGSSSPIGRLVSINSSKVKGLIYDVGSSNGAAVPVSALRIGGIVKVTTPVGCRIGAGVRLVGAAVTAHIRTHDSKTISQRRRHRVPHGVGLRVAVQKQERRARAAVTQPQHTVGDRDFFTLKPSKNTLMKPDVDRFSPETRS